jgi:hypothetical protein
VARGNPTILFDFIEKPFDQVTLSIEMRAEAGLLVADCVLAICWPNPPLCDEHSDPIAVVVSVSKN